MRMSQLGLSQSLPMRWAALPRHRSPQRGVSLLEVVLIVAIITLVSASIALVSFSQFISTHEKRAATNPRKARWVPRARTPPLWV
jgi:hypothetical protein